MLCIALSSGEVFHNFQQSLKGVPDPEKVKNPCLRLPMVAKPLPSTPMCTFPLHTHALALPGDQR